MEDANKKIKIKVFADFQNKYRRSSNFGYGSKRDQFAIVGNGELSVSKDIKGTEDMSSNT